MDISWQNETETGTNTSNLPPGLYDFFISDGEGCSDTLSIEIEAAEGLTTNFESHDASGTDVADGYIDFEIISGGTPGYAYEWDNGATTSSISNLLPGNYFLTVTDAIYCKYGFAFSVGVTTEVENLWNNSNIKIQPNPAGEFIDIELEQSFTEVCQFRLFDELGRLVLQKELLPFRSKQQINLSNIPNGFYHFSIFKAGNLEKIGKLIVFKN